MAEETLYVVVLPSGRIAKLVEPTLERSWEVTEQAGGRTGNTSNVAKVNIEVAREMVRVHLRALTRGPVPWIVKTNAEVDAAAVKAQLAELLAAEGDAAAQLAEARKALAVLDVPAEEVDLDAMVQAAREGAGGGFQELTYQDLVKAGPTSLLSLFNRYPRDFQALEAQIGLLSMGQRDPKAPPAAALLGRRVMEASS